MAAIGGESRRSFDMHGISPPAAEVPEHWHRDLLSRMRAYQIAYLLRDESWTDAEELRHHPITEKVAGQLYAAVSSIAANLAEGYSRSSGRDRARIFEYALGSARESMTWYDSASHVLSSQTIKDRVAKLEEIRRLLLAAIPRERQRLIRPSEKRDAD
jgi:four helix bundle protein